MAFWKKSKAIPDYPFALKCRFGRPWLYKAWFATNPTAGNAHIWKGLLHPFSVLPLPCGEGRACNNSVSKVRDAKVRQSIYPVPRNSYSSHHQRRGTNRVQECEMHTLSSARSRPGPKVKHRPSNELPDACLSSQQVHRLLLPSPCTRRLALPSHTLASTPPT